MKKVKIFMITVLSAMLITSSFAYAQQNNFTWFQTAGDYYVYADIPGLIGNPNVNNDIRFYANVYSPNNGTFKMTLERKVMWWWQEVGYTYVKTQNRHGWVTMGSWWSPQAGEYRVRLHSPSTPQATIFTNVKFYRHE